MMGILTQWLYICIINFDMTLTKVIMPIVVYQHTTLTSCRFSVCTIPAYPKKLFSNCQNFRYQKSTNC